MPQPGKVSGEIVFRFEADLESYEKALQEKKAIEDATPPRPSATSAPLR